MTFSLVPTGLVVSIRRVYLLKATDSAQTDPFRAVLLDLLKDKETFKRAEVVEAAAVKVGRLNCILKWTNLS